jgi:hypothetical protein
VEHIQGDHSHCTHDDDEKYRTVNLSPQDCYVIEEIMRKCDKYIDLSRPDLHTQTNESVHALKAQLAPKNLAWKSTIPARTALAILKWNEGDVAFLQVAEELNISVSEDLRKFLEERTKKRNERRDRDNDPE